MGMPHWPTYAETTWRTPRHGRRWTEAEIQYVADHVHCYTRERLARRLGRTPRAVENLQARHPGLSATTGEYLTSQQLADLTGYSPQHVTHLVRTGRLRARRKPGSTWWLFDQRIVDRLASRRGRECRAA